MAESHLRLYLEEHSHGIWWRVTETLMRGAHRELIALRTQNLAALEGEARRAAAEQLCVLRGYAAKSISETDEAGEDPLVRAAADGTAGAAGVALLLAAGAVTGGEALVAAALYGQREAAAALLDAGIDADSRSKKVPPPPSARHPLFPILPLTDPGGGRSGRKRCREAGGGTFFWRGMTALLRRTWPRGHGRSDTMPHARRVVAERAERADPGVQHGPDGRGAASAREGRRRERRRHGECPPVLSYGQASAWIYWGCCNRLSSSIAPDPRDGGREPESRSFSTVRAGA